MLLKVVFVGVRKYRLTSYSTITVEKLVLTDCVYREQCLDHLLFLGTLYIEVCAINPFWKGEPCLYVTRGFMKIFDQLFLHFCHTMVLSDTLRSIAAMYSIIIGMLQ